MARHSTGMEALLGIHSNLKALGESREEMTEKFKGYVSGIFKLIKAKYGERAKERGICDQTFGGRETGRLQANIEVEKGKREGNILALSFDFAPAQNEGEIVYGRHLTEDPRELMPITGILPIIYTCAKNAGLSSGLDYDGYISCASKISITFGGDYTAEKLPEITKLIITIDDLLDLYLKKEAESEAPSGI